MSRRKTKKTASFVAPVSDRKNLPAQSRTLIAGVKNDITIPFYNGALQHADDTLIERGQGKGLKIYDEIKRDTFASACLTKRNKHLTAREWEVDAGATGATSVTGGEAPADIEAASFVREVLDSLPFDRICEDLSGGALLKGFAISEIVWARRGDNRIVPEAVVSHDQRRFAFGEDGRPRLRIWTDMHEGIELPDRKFITHRHGVVGNNPYGLGLGHQLFWAVFFKREGVAFWLHFLDKFAGPTVVAQTPYGMLSDEQNRLLYSLADIRTSSAITVPVDTDVKFLEAARSGSVSYQDWMAYWDKQISICILGETLTTDIGDKGSRAAAETHAGMLDLLVDSDADHLSDTLHETLVKWLIEYNFPGAAIPRLWRVRPSNEKDKAETRKARAEAATAENDALVAILTTAGEIDDDEDAREFITSFDLTHSLSDRAIDRLVEARFAFQEAESARAQQGIQSGLDRRREAVMRKAAAENPAFAALFGLLGKPDHSKKNCIIR